MAVGHTPLLQVSGRAPVVQAVEAASQFGALARGVRGEEVAPFGGLPEPCVRTDSRVCLWSVNGGGVCASEEGHDLLLLTD